MPLGVTHTWKLMHKLHGQAEQDRPTDGENALMGVRGEAGGGPDAKGEGWMKTPQGPRQQAGEVGGGGCVVTGGDLTLGGAHDSVRMVRYRAGPPNPVGLYYQGYPSEPTPTVSERVAVEWEELDKYVCTCTCVPTGGAAPPDPHHTGLGRERPGAALVHTRVVLRLRRLDGRAPRAPGQCGSRCPERGRAPRGAGTPCVHRCACACGGVAAGPRADPSHSSAEHRPPEAWGGRAHSP